MPLRSSGNLPDAQLGGVPADFAPDKTTGQRPLEARWNTRPTLNGEGRLVLPHDRLTAALLQGRQALLARQGRRSHFCWNLFDRRAGDDCTVDVRELFIAQNLCNIGGLTARGRPRIVAVRGIDRVDASGAGNNVIVL